MARSDVTTTSTTPPTTTRSAGTTRPSGAPRTAPAGRPATSAWIWVIGLIIALAVIWFLWSWWDAREAETAPEVGAAGTGAIVRAVDAAAPREGLDLRVLHQVA